MATPTRYEYTFRELATLLIKDQDIHEGRWMVGFEFGLMAVHSGSDPSEIKPAALVQVNKIALSRADDVPLPPEAGLIVDAAEVNPAPEAKRKAARQK